MTLLFLTHLILVKNEEFWNIILEVKTKWLNLGLGLKSMLMAQRDSTPKGVIAK